MKTLNTFEGSLWWDSAIIRKDYARHHSTIKNGLQLRSSLRAGDYAWPGGYEIAYITDDGALLCGKCVRDELYQVLYSIRHDIHDGWRVVTATTTAELENDERCEHCAKSLDGYQ